MADWKRPLFIGIGWGLGTVVGVALVVGGFLWYREQAETTGDTAGVVQ